MPVLMTGSVCMPETTTRVLLIKFLLLLKI